jgi:hypothetical protein
MLDVVGGEWGYIHGLNERNVQLKSMAHFVHMSLLICGERLFTG